MGHEEHHHEDKLRLAFFASPLHQHQPSAPAHEVDPSADLGRPEKPHHHASVDSDPEASNPQFENMDECLHDSPAFHRHAEATTHELFYDLFFVANLTTFTSLLEINDRHSLTAYIGFFSLLWLTWYQVSLYDVRFSADSVFERLAKAIHFGCMVGFAVIGPQWKPGQEIGDYKIYKAFGFMLMVSRLTLFFQYGTTLYFTKKYKKTVLPLSLVMAWTLLAAILYGGLTPTFPKTIVDATGIEVPHKSNVYIAWYIIAISETILTVTVSCVWRIISFKGTHMVQRMSLLTLIILGEGIIVICKSISKIVKNEYLWTLSVVGQIVAAVWCIYFLYMLYFDRLQEDHFGSIKQQIWSFLHFPLHVTLVLVLQGISLLIIWRQAVEALNGLYSSWEPALAWLEFGGTVDPKTYFGGYMSHVDSAYNGVKNYTAGMAFADYLNSTVYNQVYDYIPKGVDASKEIKTVASAWKDIQLGLDNYINNDTNQTAYTQLATGINAMTSASYKTLFDTFSVTVAKSKSKKTGEKEVPDLYKTQLQYYDIFDMILSYTFIAGGLALVITATLGFLSLPQHQRRAGNIVRLAITAAAGLGLSLVSLIRYSDTAMYKYLGSSWMIPTICLTLFFCVVVDHIQKPKKKVH
ncbi:hypothetical protein EK21DRAFT_101735 [Setomelanomma holmii]|uniref:Uncharacterized protein n=1 Tax=Setomelanomma holmii TaxID=210430 RepID=A0A9P4LLD8_9PLEO|nr:hypothetical protein EK21DRAFT_101735 [Setomelanomma holmii]